VPIRLDETAYEKLRQRVLRRDRWRCQCCGSMTNLEVHHHNFRSHSGKDTEDNLITLCNNCHGRLHSGLATGSPRAEGRRILRE
jgi:5-methylcytosine-specific restriction endonuclease McrA